MWESSRKSLQDADERYQRLGFSRWVAADPQLQRRLAQLLTRQLVPLWSAQVEKHWSGRLLLFDYSGPDADNTEDLRQAWQRVLVSIGSIPDVQYRKVGSGGVPAADALNPAQISFERWPAMFSWGILWVEHAGRVGRFRDCWSYEAIRSRGREWLALNESEAVKCSLNGSTAIENNQEHPISDEF
jgi:hypothetical protein